MELSESCLEIQKDNWNIIVNYDGKLRQYGDISELERILSYSAQILQAFLTDLNLFNDKLDNLPLIELDLTLCDNESIAEINKQFRNKPEPTDVLSFPVHENLRSTTENSESLIEGGGILCLGDIFISYEVASKQSQDYNISFFQEVIHLFTHGVLHLLGYDHEISPEEEKLMFSLEEKLVKEIYKILGFEVK